MPFLKSPDLYICLLHLTTAQPMHSFCTPYFICCSLIAYLFLMIKFGQSFNATRILGEKCHICNSIQNQPYKLPTVHVVIIGSGKFQIYFDLLLQLQQYFGDSRKLLVFDKIYFSLKLLFASNFGALAVLQNYL